MELKLALVVTLLTVLVQSITNEELPLLGMMPGEDFTVSSHQIQVAADEVSRESLMNKLAKGYLENFESGAVISQPSAVHDMSAASGPPLIVLASQVKFSTESPESRTLYTVTYQERSKNVTMLANAEKLFSVGLKACTHSNPVVVLETESKSEAPALRAFCKIESGVVVMFWAGVGKGLKGPFPTDFQAKSSDQTTLVKVENHPFSAIYFREVNKESKVLNPGILLFNSTAASLESFTNVGVYRGILINSSGFQLEPNDAPDVIEFLRFFLPDNRATSYETQPRLTLLMAVRSPSAALTTRTVYHAIWPNCTLETQRPLSKVFTLEEKFEDGENKILNLWEDSNAEGTSGTGVEISVACALTEAQQIKTLVEKWGYTISVDKDTKDFVVSSYKHASTDIKNSYLWNPNKTNHTIKPTSEGITLISKALLPASIHIRNHRSITPECLGSCCKDRFVFISDVRQTLTTFNKAMHLIVSTSENKVQVYDLESRGKNPETSDIISSMFPRVTISGSTGHAALPIPISLTAHTLQAEIPAAMNLTVPATTTHGMEKLRLLFESSVTQQQDIQDLGAAQIHGIGTSKLVAGLWNSVKTQTSGDLEIYSKAAGPISYYRKTNNKDAELQFLRGKNLGDFDNLFIMNTGEFLQCEEVTNSLNKSAICKDVSRFNPVSGTLLQGTSLTTSSFILLERNEASSVHKVVWIERSTGKPTVAEYQMSSAPRFFKAAELGNGDKHLVVVYSMPDYPVIVEVWTREGAKADFQATVGKNSSVVADVVFSHRHKDADISVLLMYKNSTVEVFGVNSTKVAEKPVVFGLDLPNAGVSVGFCEVGNAQEMVVLDKTDLHYSYVSETEGRIAVSMKDFPRAGLQLLGLLCSGNQFWLRTSSELYLFQSGSRPFRFEKERWMPRAVWEGISADYLIILMGDSWLAIDKEQNVQHYTSDTIGQTFVVKGAGSLNVEVANAHKNTKVSLSYQVSRKPTEVLLPKISTLQNSQLSSEENLSLNLETDFLLDNHISNIALVSTNPETKLLHKASEVVDFRPSGITKILQVSTLHVSMSTVGLVVFGEMNTKQKVLAAYMTTSATLGELRFEEDWDVRDLRVSACGSISGWALRGYGRRAVTVFAGKADRSSKKLTISSFDVPQLLGIQNVGDMHIRTASASDCLKWTYIDPVERDLLLATNCPKQDSSAILDTSVHTVESFLLSQSEMIILYQKQISNSLMVTIHDLGSHSTHKLSINFEALGTGVEFGQISQIKCKTVAKTAECDLKPPQITDVQCLVVSSKIVFFTITITRTTTDLAKTTYTATLSEQETDKTRTYLPISNSRLLQADFSDTHVTLLSETLTPNPVTDGASTSAADQTRLWFYSRKSSSKHTRMVLSPPALLANRARKFSFVTDTRLLLWNHKSDRGKILEVLHWTLQLKRQNADAAKLVLEGPTGLTSTVSVGSLIPANKGKNDTSKSFLWIWLTVLAVGLVSVVVFLGVKMLCGPTKPEYQEARHYEEELSDVEHTLEIRDSSKSSKPSVY